MDTRLEDAERIFDIAKRLKVEQQKYARIHERSMGHLPPKQAQKVTVDLNWQAFHICKVESELHAACVDAYLAEMREPEHYEPRPVALSGFHTYMFHPARPKRLASAKAA